jgi:hypothetical protein
LLVNSLPLLLGSSQRTLPMTAVPLASQFWLPMMKGTKSGVSPQLQHVKQLCECLYKKASLSVVISILSWSRRASIKWLPVLERWNALPPDKSEEQTVAHPIYIFSYSSRDWDLMNSAHKRASLLLRRSSSTDEYANCLAQKVMDLFDKGLRDEDLISTIAAQLELEAAGRTRI